jgi:hypothetical protein
MSSFDAPAPPPAPSSPYPPWPEWIRAPEGWLGGFVPVRLTLARAVDLVVTVGAIEAFPTGVRFALEVRSRGATARATDAITGGMQLSVAFPDGSKWQGLPTSWDNPLETAPPSPSLLPMGGGGDESRSQVDFWLWPLPPAGPLTFAFSWPDHGIGETTAQIDGALLRAAAAEAEQLWQPLTAEERESAMREDTQRRR